MTDRRNYYDPDDRPPLVESPDPILPSRFLRDSTLFGHSLLDLIKAGLSLTDEGHYAEEMTNEDWEGLLLHIDGLTGRTIGKVGRR